MSEIDFSNLVIDGRTQLPAAIAHLVNSAMVGTSADNSTSAMPAVTPREFALALLQRILNQTAQDTKESIELLSKLIPNFSQLDPQINAAIDSPQLIEMLLKGSDTRFLLQLLKSNESSPQSTQLQDVTILRQRLEKLLKLELKDNLVGQLLEVLAPLESSANTRTILDVLTDALDPKRGLSLDNKKLLLTLLQNREAGLNVVGTIDALLPEVISAVTDLVNEVSNPEIKKLASTIVARVLQQALVTKLVSEPGATEANFALADVVLSNLSTNSALANQAHNPTGRAALVDFLFSNKNVADGAEIAQALKLLLATSQNLLDKPLYTTISSLVEQIAAPLPELLKLVHRVDQELSSSTIQTPSPIIKAIRQQLHLVLEHAIAIGSLDDPQSLVMELRLLEGHPERVTTQRANQIISLAEHLLTELERERKQPAARLLEKLQRARTRIDEEPISDQKDKAALIASADRLIRGQELVRQLSPVLQALGEPSVFFFPSFLSGLFAQLEVLAYPAKVPETDQQEKKNSKRAALKTIEFRTSFRQLGDTEVKIQYDQHSIYLTLGFARDQVVPLVQAKLFQLEQRVRSLGYTEVGFCARPTKVKDTIVKNKLSRNITA